MTLISIFNMRIIRKLNTLWYAMKFIFFKKQSKSASGFNTEEFCKYLVEEGGKKRIKEYSDWCEQMRNVPTDYILVPKDKFIVDIELQPYRWLIQGVDLIDSCKGNFSIPNFDSRQGQYLDTYILYSVFQMGVEIFLKGMWLCQFEECRNLHDNGHIIKSSRQDRLKDLKKMGHDLIKLIKDIGCIKKYKDDEYSVKFLKIIEGVIRYYYYPLYAADKRSNEWANSRYPKRFYKDKTKEGKSDALHTYPQQWPIVELFRNMDKHLEGLWGLKANLTRKRQK